MERKLYRFAVLTAVLGLAALAGLMISQAAYPDMLFRVLEPAGLLLIFLSCGLFAADWITSMTKQVKSKNYLCAAVLLVVGIIFVVQMVVSP